MHAIDDTTSLEQPLPDGMYNVFAGKDAAAPAVGINTDLDLKVEYPFIVLSPQQASSIRVLHCSEINSHDPDSICHYPYVTGN